MRLINPIGSGKLAMLNTSSFGPSLVFFKMFSVESFIEEERAMNSLSLLRGLVSFMGFTFAHNSA